MAQDEHANRNKCKFQIAYIADDCSPSSLSSPPHLIKTCGMKDGHVACSIACETGYRFIDEDKITKTYMCKDKMWFPSGVTPACVPMADEPARYEVTVELTYPIETPVPEQCLKGYTESVSKNFDALDEVLSSRCSGPLPVYVRALDAVFHNTHGAVVSNITIQILPSVLQDVFYDLCGLTLRTIFDLRIPGTTEPVRPLLAIAGDSIASHSGGCPSLTATKSNVVQGFGCSNGEVLRQSAKEKLPECLPCPVGSVNVNNTCILCPPGSYQDEEGKTACKACPDGTFTLYEGAHRAGSCLAVCGNGMYSESGLVPCQLCPRHTYSGAPSLGGFRKCTPCPEGTFTAKLGSSTASQCKMACQPGMFSVTGMEPCSPCPMHHYQPDLGQQRCIRCSNSTATTSEGMSLESACLPVDCHLLHCQNQAGCSVKNHKPVCNCKPGWIGERCETPEPMCDSKPCFNGGTCTPEYKGGYTCSCPTGIF
ncbi:hypothetical protein WR25_22382 isoform B [Diploscapter pachys]|uniref:EGF-like domain-containing protein n=1 Tax=Diploscapter pachys TaxID=2018661 RepID=A0A2A2L4D8_9BILA|nr:hypothetical protein WR25_22382 isoform A [Diploscapter pachys]PAV81136.1 hypothetical protein WR25_22382 isoform B [Diploscapter pachys]